MADREHLTRPLYDWWNDELMGVHFHSAEQTTGRSTKQVVGKVEGLNLKMFNPDPTTRLKSVSLLTSEANRKSIPFLVLALQDPDNDVAFEAYKILHRLIPVLGLVKDAAFFNANRGVASQPVYDWWRDELLGKHLTE